MRTLYFLSGGAAQGLVRELQPAFEAAHGCRLEGTFGAVGAMKDKLLGGAPCDLLILTHALIAELASQGHAEGASARPLGLVKTGVAVKQGAAAPDVGSPDALRKVLEQAGAVYFPDPAKATAGIHFMKVLTGLGVADGLAPRLRTFPNGATAMAALAQAPEANAVGCTQVTEILITKGVQLVGLLPPPYELATTYTAAVATRAAEPALAAELIAALTAAEAAAKRKECGFE
ncbi:substrate-binding domain-containing protein [Ramlibacter sp. XY19]|uniref:substrate-binding domain-containing protein n=1 Tax=Ramlibacter paludis TaxID=2908000 RepID=UPI0023DA1C45|nr:substrate-binding domain-containing protein [Ramlibacter paludis]MCG2594931.1 substrate-binding domain-containing protein [Ramlibacter paludis]